MRFFVTATFAIYLAITLSACASLESESPAQLSQGRAEIDESDLDAALQRSAVEALGEREGTVIVMDPQTGRIRALVNQRLAFEQAFPPGSAIKPFTALAALRAGLIDSESGIVCRQRYESRDFEIVCSHGRIDGPLKPAKAIAYSCNFYFSSLAERLSESAFDSTAAAFGFGARTGVNRGVESNGRLERGQWQLEDALGDGEHLLVTPIQMVVAYCALVNGGRVMRPQVTPADQFTQQQRAAINILDSHRALLVEGMRGAVEFGTASRTGLASQAFFFFGKTGTSTSSNEFRTQGWFTGFAAENNAPAPDAVKLAVLVFLKRARGADAADVAAPVLRRYADYVRSGPGQALDTSQPERPSINRRPRQIKVHLVREGATRTIGVEDYISGVLTAEASVEDQPEALKAQAIVSRTFALKNLGRHAEDGYDFCSTTHCQRFSPLDSGPAAISSREAAIETEDLVIKDNRGQLTEIYFHAACGGMTADFEALWGAAGPAHLRPVRDDYCATMPNRNWVEAISTRELLEALAADDRSDPGEQLNDVVVTRRDSTGRAELISIEGRRRRVLRGWDFKLIVCRKLGWNRLKSSRFEVTRRGSTFVFRGSGFGHGLGMCQVGAHVMARRGASYTEILSHYYPDTSVLTELDEKASGPETVPSSARFDRQIRLVSRPAGDQGRPSLSSEYFRIWYPAELARTDVEHALRALEAARADIARRLASASLTLAKPRIEVVIHSTTQDFSAATGQPWWAAGASRRDRIELQPIRVLKRRAILTTTLRHEYTHTVIESLSKGDMPRWMTEGLAAYVAGEGVMLARMRVEANLTDDDLEKRLAHPNSSGEMRMLYAAAYRKVRELIRTKGEAAVWRLIAGHAAA